MMDDPDHTQAAVVVIAELSQISIPKERWIALAGVHKHIYVGNPRCVHMAMQHLYPQVRGQDIFIVYRIVAGTYTDVQHKKVSCIPVLYYIQRVGSS